MSKSRAVLKSILFGLAVSVTSALVSNASYAAEKPAPAKDAASIKEKVATTKGKAVKAENGDIVNVHYTGWLQMPDKSKGAQFDSSRTRGVPIRFPLGTGQVIKGWDKGLHGMIEGEKKTLVIPPGDGYGDRDMGVIPPNSTLIFDVELVKIEKSQ